MHFSPVNRSNTHDSVMALESDHTVTDTWCRIILPAARPTAWSPVLIRFPRCPYGRLKHHTDQLCEPASQPDLCVRRELRLCDREPGLEMSLLLPSFDLLQFGRFRSGGLLQESQLYQSKHPQDKHSSILEITQSPCTCPGYTCFCSVVFGVGNELSLH